MWKKEIIVKYAKPSIDHKILCIIYVYSSLNLKSSETNLSFVLINLSDHGENMYLHINPTRINYIQHCIS